MFKVSCHHLGNGLFGTILFHSDSYGISAILSHKSDHAAVNQKLFTMEIVLFAFFQERKATECENKDSVFSRKGPNDSKAEPETVREMQTPGY